MIPQLTKPRRPNLSTQLIDKENLRKHYRAWRSKLSAAEIDAAAQAAVATLTSQPAFVQNRKIACYLPYKNEFDCKPIIQAIWAHEKECFLPVLSGGALKFMSYQPLTRLQKNHYGIFEPVESNVISTEMLDLVLLPLTAFDSHGLRLGTGGGFYDKTFAFLNEQPEHRPLMVGLAYAGQQAERIPSDPWDIKLDAVLTEKSWQTTK